MTDYAFVLGKNWLLSLAELIVYLHDRGLAKQIKDYSRTAAIVEIEEELDDEQLVEIQSALGGCFKIGRVVSAYDRQIVETAFPVKGKIGKKERSLLQQVPWLNRIWGKPKNARIKFGVSTYSLLGSQSTIDLRRLTLGLDEWTKRKLLSTGARKASYYVYEGPDRRNANRPNVALWPQTIAKHGLLNYPNAEILVLAMESSVYLAKTVVVYDSSLQQYRDEARPYISAEISTSPKICRTLLNLSGARPGDVVLDPFCGTGTLLLEAAILGMRCIGIDIENDAVQGASSNLKWLGRELGDWIDFQIMKGDARTSCQHVGKQVDAVAFEPDLGPIYGEKPTREDAVETLERLTELYREVLASLDICLRPGGRIGMTLPVINSIGGPMTINLEDMIRGTSFEIVDLLPHHAFSDDGPRHKQLAIVPDRKTIPERKRGQIVERNVVMLGKA